MLQNTTTVLRWAGAIVLSGVAACTQTSAPSATLPATPPTPTPIIAAPEHPNLRFQVQQQSGNCPSSIGIWEILLPLEGGADHIVVADIRPAQIAASTPRSVTYAAPLPAEFASCVGQAIAPGIAAYRFDLRQGQVFFQVAPQVQVGVTILSKQLASGRPYVFWRAESP